MSVFVFFKRISSHKIPCGYILHNWGGLGDEQGWESFRGDNESHE